MIDFDYDDVLDIFLVIVMGCTALWMVLFTLYLIVVSLAWLFGG